MIYTEDEIEAIKASGIFDKEWYTATYSDVKALGIDPLTHFLHVGVLLQRSPSQVFNLQKYANLKNISNGRDAIRHFLSSKKDICKINNNSKNEIEKFSDEQLLASSPLFDPRWYLIRYKDVYNAGIDPLSHFLRNGGRELRNPSLFFDSSFYHEKYKSIMKYENPLVDYIRNGQFNNFLYNNTMSLDTWWINFYRDETLDTYINDYYSKNELGYNSMFFQIKNTASVVLPVYNAPAEIEQCIDSILKNTHGDYRVIVIDDASPDPAVEIVLNKFRHINQIEIYENKKNIGYTKTINRGIKIAGQSDVVLLNSDTLVSKNWLNKLKFAAYSAQDIATVTPLSNNAGAFSVPKIGTKNLIPAEFTWEQFARAVAQTSKHFYPTVPTGNGFCMYIRRECIDKIGCFDDIAFPYGYGEENDFCMRAKLYGLRNIIDDSTIIYHARSASFGSKKDELLKSGRNIIDQRYPEYTKMVRAFCSDPTMEKIRKRISLIGGKEKQEIIKKRILYVISTKSGGTPQTNQDLMMELSDVYETFVLRCDANIIEFYLYNSGQYFLLDYHVLESAIKGSPHTSPEYDFIVTRWLVKYFIELIHVRHIAWHSLNLIFIAKQLDIPVIFSFHDFYTVCPTIKLLDGDYSYCGGNCTPTNDTCTPELWGKNEFPQLKHAFVHQWRRMFAKILQQCDAYITTSSEAKDLLCEIFPFLKNTNFSVIPHGRNFKEFFNYAKDYKKNDTLRIVVPGNISVAKGMDILIELGKYADQYNFELHLLGLLQKKRELLASSNSERIFLYGKYDRDNFSMSIQNISPHVGAIFSIWPETYCHTLTELWSCGIPAIGFDIGAVGKRIINSGCGWDVSPFTCESILATIKKIKDDPYSIKQKISAVNIWQNTEGKACTCSLMALRYHEIYAQYF